MRMLTGYTLALAGQMLGWDFDLARVPSQACQLIALTP